MNDVFIVFLAGLAGVGLGAIFFGGLWWTVRHGIASGRPGRWLLIGRVLRMAVALIGFYFVGAGQWPRLVACLAGFIVARFMVLRLTKKQENRDAA